MAQSVTRWPVSTNTRVHSLEPTFKKAAHGAALPALRRRGRPSLHVCGTTVTCGLGFQGYQEHLMEGVAVETTASASTGTVY